MIDKKEKAVEEVEVMEGKVVDPNFISFSKPHSFEGVTYEGITLDLDSLTGKDLEVAEVQFVSENPSTAAQTPLKEMSKGYQALLAAKAGKVNVALIRSLRANEYASITMKVQIFLLTQG
ncbi:phage tail assembly protein [Sporosarcina sp. FSL K6-5500]|uniref:phage tail assembly protein n=1 Tax=Sporosarcina sp. FSL K6-5500 TaxID=2921558 RepID=UPI0030FC9F30